MYPVQCFAHILLHRNRQEQRWPKHNLATPVVARIAAHTQKDHCQLTDLPVLMVNRFDALLSVVQRSVPQLTIASTSYDLFLTAMLSQNTADSSLGSVLRLGDVSGNLFEEDVPYQFSLDCVAQTLNNGIVLPNRV